MSIETKVSIIITVKNNGIDLFMTMESLKVSYIGLAYEVIIVDEGSIDGCCDFLLNYKLNRPIRKIKGQAGKSSRNLAASLAVGEYFVFCSPRLYFEDNWMETLLEPLFQGTAEGVSPVFEIEERVPSKLGKKYTEGILHSIQSYPWTQNGDGLPWLSTECFAVSRSTFQECGGMENGFKSKELETAEFSLRMWLLGARCMLVQAVSLIQVLRINFPYDDSVDKWEEDLLILAQLHFNEQRIAACESLLSEASCAAGKEDMAEDLVGDTSASRERYVFRRKHDDSWFVDRFDIPL
ncbi:glycosyltransferase involved in cell wall biosynthesis [Fontibacillus solani]|uniref:Glycosyltransferase involved in cell wall biosynthesis n=1 Tax=Fontibacillus solani TaxID=1572857 RepID=A0A7W3SW92_9BACL|nr:glycosyltransferase [Fontibacillus solani]MBA9087401.1 glycosyltransferase involved in cell wall biosynthesis [Fontibacillus solani]